MRIAEADDAGHVVLIAMNLYFWHHLDKPHADGAPAGYLLIVKPPQRVAAPGDDGKVRAHHLIQQRHLTALQRDLRLDKHFAYRGRFAFAFRQQRAFAILRHRLEAHFQEVAFNRRQIVEQPRNTVAHRAVPAFRRRQHVAGGHRQVDHRFGMIAPFLLVAVEQRLASFAPHHQRQLPPQVKGVAHAAVIALPLPDRHDVRGVARQQHAIDAKAFGDARVMGVDALADRLDVVRVR